MMKLSDRALRELGIAPPYLQEYSEVSNHPTPATRMESALSPSSSASPAGSEKIRPAPLSEKSRSQQTPSPALSRSTENLAAISQFDWNEVVHSIESCSACRLNQTRTRVVPGVGDRQADWLFVGEAPGAEEDRRGEPFVGAAGMLLDSMLAALHLSRQKNVYIANVIKCRPPDNRTPEASECQACMPYLERQIALIQPKVIVALGRVAAQSLLRSEINLGSLRNKVHAYEGIPVVVTFHPAYLLRNLPEKAKAWADLCLAKKVLDQA